jgi:hypothetical protein
MTTNEYIAPTLMYQELERLKFAQNLRKNPSEYSAYVNQRINTMTDEIFNKKRAAFQKAHIDLGRYMDMDHNVNFYKSRSADVDRLTESIEQNNNRIKQSAAMDKDVTKRQFEINEWYNYNKLETLFFLQLFFISVLSGAVIIYLNKNGAVTNALASLLMIILVVIVGGVGLYRYFYTTRTRDPRLWHRRYFDEDAKAPKPPVKCDQGGDVVFDVNDVLPKSITECADDAVVNFQKWQTNLQDEIAAYQTTGKDPALKMGSICSISK